MPLFPLQSKGKYPVEGDGSHNEALRRVPLDRYSLDKRGGIVTIDSDQAVADAIRILGDRLILSAPVRDVTADAGADWKDKYLGCIDFLSIINWLMDSSWGLMPASLDELRHLKRRFAKTTIANLLSYSRATPFIPLDLNTNDFVDAMILLGKYGIRRVFTVDGARGDILGVISQRNAIEVIASNLGEFEDMRAKTLQQLGIAHECDVVSIDLDDSYWDAFLAIHEKGVNSVAILDENRKVIGNISMGDLKRVITSDAKFASLGRPLRETWKHEHDLYTCKPTDTFEKVCETFAMTGVHSLYVVDPQFRPIGVVRVRDLLSSCVREPAVKAQAFNAYFTGHRAEIMQE